MTDREPALTRFGAYGLGLLTSGVGHGLVAGLPWWVWVGWALCAALILASIAARRFL